MLVKADDVLLKEGDGQSRRTRRRLALCVLMTLISIAVPVSHATALPLRGRV